MPELTPLLSRSRLTAAQLEDIYAAFSGREGFAGELIRQIPLIDSQHVCRPIGLLRMIAEDRGLDSSSVSKMLQHLDAMDHWLARLLCCQLLSITGCPTENEDDTFPFLADCFRDRRVIIRAWALTTLTHFTGAHHKKAIASMLAAARKDPSKAMQARLRHLSASSSSPRKQRS